MAKIFEKLLKVMTLTTKVKVVKRRGTLIQKFTKNRFSLLFCIYFKGIKVELLLKINYITKYLDVIH